VEHPVSRTIVDAECNAIFMDLIQDEPFRDYAVEYLSRQAHGDTRKNYIALLSANGMADLASTIEGQADAEPHKSLKVFAVDDSKMILNIYRSVLHNLGCDPVLFEFPAEVINTVKKQKPDLIFTDLNMPEISGVDLTKAVREMHSKEQLPIIMVTTQNECQDNDAAMEAGISAILHKPFNEDSLRQAMEKHLKTN
jgi:CheY-like chemotaxis protein